MRRIGLFHREGLTITLITIGANAAIAGRYIAKTLRRPRPGSHTLQTPYTFKGIYPKVVWCFSRRSALRAWRGASLECFG